MSTRDQARRALASHYPFLPARGRIPFLQGPTTSIPAGVVVQTRSGISVRVAPDWMYHDVYYWGDYEPFQTKVYRRIVRPGDTVLDVGTNFGWYAAVFARTTGAQGRVHAFEPVPFIHELAMETLALNDLADRVELNQLALGGSEGTVTIRTYAGLPHGHATVADLSRTDSMEHVCGVTTLDAYCGAHEIEKVDFLKVDAEGSEPDVLAGGRRLLESAGAPVVAFEINSACLAARSLRPSDVVSELTASGYTSFYSLSTRSGIRQCNPADSDGGDYLAAKAEHRDRIELALKTGRLLR